MTGDHEGFQIPNEFADYRRRLIIFSDQETMHTEFDSIARELQQYGALEKRMTFPVGNTGFQVVYISGERRTVAEVIADLQPKYAKFRFEGDVRIALAALAVNDPLYPRQWALHKVEAAAAWERVEQMPAGPAVAVAIVDSGIKPDHEDLLGANITGLRIIPPLGGTFADDTGHGTMIAGVIGAVTNNAIGMAGEARNVQILALKITDERTPPTALAAALGILVAFISGAKIINASWHALADSDLLSQTIHFVGEQGCLVVVAAGNYGSNNSEIPTLPAGYGFHNMVVAMASDRHDDKCWFSNYGLKVDLAAPGMAVQSTGIYYISPRYPNHSGTSIAAAQVSAAAALLQAIDNWTPNEIHEHLNASADHLRSLQGLCRSNGRLNLRRAVCGPFNLLSPIGGALLTRGSSLNVQWTLDYVAPVVSAVEISFRQKDGTVLSSFGGLPNSGLRSVTVPSLTTEAFVRVKCQTKNLYTDSAVFNIV